MDGQPRHQYQPPTTASNRTITRRPPAPFVAHRARRQRQLKASSHDHDRIRRNAFAPTTFPSSPSREGRIITTNYFHQHNLNKRRSGGSCHRVDRAAVLTGLRPASPKRTGEEIRKEYFGGLSAVRTFGDRQEYTEDAPAGFKGCLRHTSKGDS